MFPSKPLPRPPSTINNERLSIGLPIPSKPLPKPGEYNSVQVNSSTNNIETNNSIFSEFNERKSIPLPKPPSIQNIDNNTNVNIKEIRQETTNIQNIQDNEFNLTKPLKQEKRIFSMNTHRLNVNDKAMSDTVLNRFAKPNIPPPKPPSIVNEIKTTSIIDINIQSDDNNTNTTTPVFRGQWNPSIESTNQHNININPNDVCELTDESINNYERIIALRNEYLSKPPPTPDIMENSDESDNDFDNNNDNSDDSDDESQLLYSNNDDNDNNVDDILSSYFVNSDDEESPPIYSKTDDNDEESPLYSKIDDNDEEPPPYSLEDEFDNEELLAYFEAESDNMGSDNLDECKIVVQWSEEGSFPPVPSRNDPSYYLSESKALQFIQQKEEVPDAYRIIAEDPRFKRLKLKWAPNVFSTAGAKQFAKNKIDPATLPYVGILFHMNRVREAKNGHAQIDKLQKNVTPELEQSLAAFKGAQTTRALQESAYTGVAACCMMLPVVDFIPGLSAQLMILGEVGAGVAESGIEMGLKVVISKGTGQLTSSVMESTDAFGGFGSSKAFLLYLGLPKTDDPLYAEWEPYRLKLKALYGCAPEDNLAKMKPKGQILKQIQKEEKKTGKPYKIEIPLLVLLFRAFDCWHELYWDRIIKVKDAANGKTRSILGLNRQLTLEERRRMRDYRKLQESATVIESKTPINPHLQILRKKKWRKEIINLFTKSLLHSYHVAYLFTRKKLRDEQKGNLKWFMKMVVDYFFAHNAFFWGYVGTDNELKAVAIWERPNELAKISFLSMIRTSGAIKLGPNRWKKMSDILFKIEEIRKNDIRGLRCWMLHWIAVDPRFQKQGLGRLLIENTMRRHEEPIYIQLFNIEIEVIEFLKRLCFVPVCHINSKFILYGQQVNVIGYWYGIQSPQELRALLPAKKKNPLKLTYSTLRRATSLQSVTRKAQIQRKERVLLLESQENKLYQEAKQRYEETSTLLDHLKMNLASLPTENRETNQLAQSLQHKIKEQQHLLNIYKTSLEDAKKNINAMITSTN